MNPEWLNSEAKKPYRLGPEFLNSPLHLVNGVRVGMVPGLGTPQRFAQMLLVTQDHLAKCAELDFFSAAMFVPEVAQLGNSLKEISELGAEAERKLAALPSMSDDMVTATVYELLVGAACVRKGLKLTMVEENRERKVPDYQITGLAPTPVAIECKRRLGLTVYELDEANYVEELYKLVRPALHDRGTHGSIEVVFNVPVRAVSQTDFIEAALTIVGQKAPSKSKVTQWGALTFHPLPYLRSIRRTRLYAPDFLEQVFEWDTLQDEWDGLLCEVEPPREIIVELVRSPLCLKWRSESEEALRKKTRGITSLWADAVKQIPDGELGFIYIAYQEGARPQIADARTSAIVRSGTEVWHRWSVLIPMMLVNRLYARCTGVGMPDLIESVLVAPAKGEELWEDKFPWQVFTAQTKQK